MVRKLQVLGIAIDDEDVHRESAGGSVGRPHVARALRRKGIVATLDEAFERFLGRGRPAFVDKALPTFTSVTSLVHRLGGVVSAAHLKERMKNEILENLSYARTNGTDKPEFTNWVWPL